MKSITFLMCLLNLNAMAKTVPPEADVLVQPTSAITMTRPEEIPRRVIECQEEPAVADDGFLLYLAPTDFDEKIFSLTIERSLRIGRRSENYFVINKTPSQPVGSSALYKGSTIQLSIQGTTTPRPDNKNVGHFSRHFGSHQVERRDLLCTFN